MQAFDIFRPGKQTASNGIAMDFAEDLLVAAVAAYDPAVHEAPIVVGHPKDNHPAFGWIKSLSYSDGVMVAEPDQVDPDFAELVEKGRYKKRSASFYLPDSPSNPVPGTLYLRHVGFLGAQPPAVKGLRDVAFSDAEEGVVEFAEVSPYSFSVIGSALRGLRDWMIGKEGLEMADKVLPSYYIDEVNGEADRMRNQQAKVEAAPLASFNEPQAGDTAMTPEQIAALQAENDKLKAQAAQAADFAEAEKNLKAREAALVRKEIDGEIDTLVAAGKVLPAQKAGLAEFMASLGDADQVVEFGEGDDQKKVSPRQFMRDYLASMPKLVDFKEHARDDGANVDFDVKAAEQKIFDQVSTGKAGA
jgi:hypothetical protein